jgi:hypothetical protein
MPILNASIKDVHTKVFGNWHFIKAGQIKNFQADVEQFMATERGSLGLVPVPEEFNDPEYRSSEEGQKELAEYKKQGVMKRVAHLQFLRHNELVSLKQDLEIANIKVDPLIMANPKIEEAFQELVSYQTAQDDADKHRVERMRKLDRKIVANSDALVNKPSKQEE